MAQRKKQKSNKKSKTTHKHIQNHHQTIIQQTIPNYSSGQTTGHQYNKNKVSFVPQHAENATDNIVGELVGRLMSKIENDGDKQTQEYSKEIKPINNTNSSTVNIYNNGTIKEEKKDEEKKDSSTTIINNQGRSAGEDFGIQAGASAASLLGVGALGYAANSNAANAAKLKLKKAGTGVLGAVTSGIGAIGTTINNNVLKRGNKIGGTASSSNLLKQEGKQYEKQGFKGTTYGNLVDEPNPLQSDFDNYINKPSTRKQSNKPSEIILTNPSPSIFTPTKQLLNMFTPTSTPARTANNITTQTPKLNTLNPLSSPQTAIKTPISVPMQDTLVTESGIKAPKLRLKREARITDINEATRQGATTTRIFEKNQEIAKRIKAAPLKTKVPTEISNASTRPRAMATPVVIKEEPKKRGRKPKEK